MPLTYKDVAEILKLIDASDCEELAVEVDDLRLVVRRRGAGGKAEAVFEDAGGRFAGSAADFEAPVGSKTPGPPGSEAEAAPAAPADGRIELRAPMVGTFYRAPGPQEAPFVELGDRVAAGDPLGLLEVMKLYTTLEAPAPGCIVVKGITVGRIAPQLCHRPAKRTT